MNQTNTRAMVETAFLSAIIVMLTIVGASVPLLSLLATIVAPAATALVGIRWGTRYSCAAVVVSFVLVSIILGPLTALGTVLMYAVPSIFLGMGFRNYWNPTKLILLPTIALCLTTIATVLVTFSVTSFDVSTAWQSFDTELRDSLMTAVQQQQLPAEQVEAYMQQVGKSFEQIKRMIVAYGFCAMAVVSYVMARFTAFMAKRTNNPVQSIPSISTWHMPIWSAGVLAVGLILVYGSSYLGINNYIITTIGMNLGLFGAFVCGLNGIACLLGILNTCKISRFIKILILGFLYVMTPIGLIIFGIMDMFMDLRSRYQSRNQ